MGVVIAKFENLDGQLCNNEPNARTDFNTKEVIVDKDGNREWHVIVEIVDDKGYDAVKVCVKAKENPVRGLRPKTLIRFVNAELVMGMIGGNPGSGYGKQWCKISAESVRPLIGGNEGER